MAIKKTTGEYDVAFAETSMADIQPIVRGGYTGLDFPTGNRIATPRAIDNRAEYDLFRPVSKLPRQQRDIVEACMNAYYRIGLLRNVIDMMSSFGCQGIQIVHPKKSSEEIYKAWFKRIKGSERSERFLNGLFRSGNVIVKRSMAKLSSSDMNDLRRSVASLGPDAEYERELRPNKNTIPIEYTFLNPATIEMPGGDLATFLGHPVYILKIPNFIITMIKAPKTPDEKALVADLPAFIREPIKAGQKFVKLDNDKLSVYHYMKDDWQQWAYPVTYSILTDLVLYEKMKMADEAALDGAISHIRLWLLGSLKDGIQVGPQMYQKLHDMLASNVGGGAMDLIWDAAIDLKETGTDVSKFLGSEKYEPVLKSIFAGLGIPQSLAGGGSNQSGFTNNAISLKTLIERLQYGRDQLTDFWDKEIQIMQEALGDKKPARIVYDNMSLYDEAAEKMLWFQLYDRHLVDDETIQEKFGMIPEVINMRIKREEKARDGGKKPPKAGAYHDPQSGHELTKIALQQGTLAPTEAGVEKKPKKPGDKSTLDVQTEQAAKDRNLQKQQQEAQIELEKKKQAQEAKQGNDLHGQKLQQNDEQHKMKLQHMDQEHKTLLPIKKDAFKKKTTIQLQNQKKGLPGQGRPKNSKDTVNRKQRTPKPSSKAIDMIALQEWARDVQGPISEHCSKQYLIDINKKNLRALSSEESQTLETTKFMTLCNTFPFTIFTPSNINPLLPSPITDAMDIYEDLYETYRDMTGTEPPIEKQRDMRASAYAIWHCGV